ncbi:MAG: riboflavin synthase [Halieaceae bacterium]|nr:riboflavin synthase [Halieaceae bacterium]
MFTGLVEEVGRVKKIESIEMDIRLCIETREKFLEGVTLGESIAVSGVCLTVTDVSSSFFWADVSVETLKTTTIGFWQIGSEVNLERSLTPESRMGGHMVTGHIDGVGELIKIDVEGRSWRFLFRVPLDLSRYVARKGSICIDGTSLTVNSVIDSNFEVNIIPKTMDCTIFSNYIKGSMVNLEVDLIARYLERLSSDG